MKSAGRVGTGRHPDDAFDVLLFYIFDVLVILFQITDLIVFILFISS